MTIHYWGDKGVDWDGISSSADEIGDFLRRWGRVGVRDTKEKWGLSRVVLSFGWYQFHSITHPGYMFNCYPNWLWELDCKYSYKVMNILNYIIIPYHQWLYKLAYKKAVLKRPHLIAEIINGADYPEYLEGLFPEWQKWNKLELIRTKEEFLNSLNKETTNVK